jgi:hypothetical protein
MTEQQTTKATTRTRATRKPAAAKVTPITDAKGATSTGRTTTGDNGGGRKPRATKAPAKQATTPTPAKKTGKALMGPSGYRVKYGTTDAAVFAAVREHGTKNEWPPFTDAELLALIGWAITPATAIRKVAASLPASA